MPNIRAELVKATGTDKTKGEDEQDYLLRLAVAVNRLPQKDFDALSDEAAEWSNTASEVINANKGKKRGANPDPLPSLPEEPEQKPTTRRNAAPEPAPAPAPAESGWKIRVGENLEVTNKRGKVTTGKVLEVDDDNLVLDVNGQDVDIALDKVSVIKHLDGPETGSVDPLTVGNVVAVTNKRGKVTEGTVVEVDADNLVLDVNGQDVDIARDKITAVELVSSGDGASTDEPDDGVAVGAVIEATNKRGKVSKGEVVMIDAETIVIDVGGGVEEDLNRERVTSIKVISKAKAVAKEAAKKPSAAPAPAATSAAPEKGKRITNEGVSVSARMMEIMADDPEVTEDEIAKILTAEGLAFRENTLGINFKSNRNFLKILKEAGRLK